MVTLLGDSGFYMGGYPFIIVAYLALRDKQQGSDPRCGSVTAREQRETTKTSIRQRQCVRVFPEGTGRTRCVDNRSDAPCRVEQQGWTDGEAIENELYCLVAW